MDKTQKSVHEIYYGSDGGATRRLMTRLEKTGQRGRIAAQLFRAQKASSRAKVYRGGIRDEWGGVIRYKDLAYEKKEKELIGLTRGVLKADSQGLRWGWKPDPPHGVTPNSSYTPIYRTDRLASIRRSDTLVLIYEGEWDRRARK